ncbi:hypothetical protein KFE25_003771 [Diacronema lutheri]|uniref:Amine oxidase domain-containing protein n=1 Tax=Diacronema lutheri TaxID=2081491 RepID=A0A8J5X757_DIALT|nr:hypothetical protein KFE25_003771 [Diacronema lutheri]
MAAMRRPWPVGVRRARRIAAVVCAGGLWLGCAAWICAPSARSPIHGRIVGASIGLGHRLAAGLAPGLGGAAAPATGAPRFPPPARREDVGVVIVGGGIAGLTAGWRLLRSGWSDFALLELEASVGGNARGARMAPAGDGGEMVEHPWAAHYVPLPSAENVLLRDLLADAGAVVASGSSGAPRWETSLVCPLPVERLFAPEAPDADGARARAGSGRWLECADGLLPSHLLTDDDRAQLRRLRAAVAAEADGRDGARRFAVPVAHSLVDARAIALDRTPALRWLTSVNVTSERVLWWAEYGMRDDYGVALRDASAWALVHYFAARDSDERLEGADGNGWLVRFLARAAGSRVRTRALVTAVVPLARQSKALSAARGERASGGATVRYWDEAAGESVELRARRVIYAAPRFTAKHIVNGYTPSRAANFTYAPWVVANVGLRAPPPAERQPVSRALRALASRALGGAADGGGSAWGYRACDSVIYNGPGGAPVGEGGGGLGYALTTSHAARARRSRWRSLLALLWPPAWPERRAAVLTHFTALTDLEPAAARAWLLGTSWAYWRERVLAELEVAHAGIRALVTRVDVAFLAHAMVRPTVGFVWGDARRLAAVPHASVVHWAHSDMSGLSLVEEAV